MLKEGRLQGQQHNAGFPPYFFPPFTFLIFYFGCPDTPTDHQKAAGPITHLLRGFAIQAWSVFTKIIQVVFFALVLDA